MEKLVSARFWAGVAQMARSRYRAFNASLCLSGRFRPALAAGRDCCVQCSPMRFSFGASRHHRIEPPILGRNPRDRTVSHAVPPAKNVSAPGTPSVANAPQWPSRAHGPKSGNRLHRVHNRLVSMRAGNLPLAARRRVGHIGRTGDVAEWLKAAVC